MKVSILSGLVSVTLSVSLASMAIASSDNEDAELQAALALSKSADGGSTQQPAKTPDTIRPVGSAVEKATNALLKQTSETIENVNADMLVRRDQATLREIVERNNVRMAQARSRDLLSRRIDPAVAEILANAQQVLNLAQTEESEAANYMAMHDSYLTDLEEHRDVQWLLRQKPEEMQAADPGTYNLYCRLLSLLRGIDPTRVNASNNNNALNTGMVELTKNPLYDDPAADARDFISQTRDFLSQTGAEALRDLEQMRQLEGVTVRKPQAVTYASAGGSDDLYEFDGQKTFTMNPAEGREITPLEAEAREYMDIFKRSVDLCFEILDQQVGLFKECITASRMLYTFYEYLDKYLELKKLQPNLQVANLDRMTAKHRPLMKRTIRELTHNLEGYIGDNLEILHDEHPGHKEYLGIQAILEDLRKRYPADFEEKLTGSVAQAPIVIQVDPTDKGKEDL